VAFPPREGERGRVRRIVVGALAVVVVGALAQLLGWDVVAWFRQLWDAVTGIPIVYVVAGCAAGLVQTTATALGWWAVLRYGFPAARVPWRSVWAVYAVSVALNGILPANLGTLMMLLMFTTLIAGRRRGTRERLLGMAVFGVMASPWVDAPGAEVSSLSELPFAVKVGSRAA
jgi:uncharacterized membrane protein YbhN (UPF0104 family)